MGLLQGLSSALGTYYGAHEGMNAIVLVSRANDGTPQHQSEERVPDDGQAPFCLELMTEVQTSPAVDDERLFTGGSGHKNHQERMSSRRSPGADGNTA